MAQDLILPTCYLPNLSYFNQLSNADAVALEKYEHFPKQTFRTRTQIATANGILELIIPIIHGKKDRVPMKDVRINYDEPWQRLHWMSIQTAYRRSAYFEFYEDDFRPFYEQKETFLFDFHLKQLQVLLKMLKLEKEIHFTDSFEEIADASLDRRKIIHPKKPSLISHPVPYYQVFEEKNGFIPNLSIIDLLFNQGPQAKAYL
ncbi:WbqC family protein [Sphingobacterium sp. HJSM2_6]|uniref:WbqC family protein n=1 Tax=Sphingobacterium sp. HJSM2_6 TaxID=3366264 RepID=UPI003BCCB521